MVRYARPVPLAFFAPIMMLVVPTAAGVGTPEMRPLAVLSVRPAGRPDALKLVGPHVAVIMFENTTPTMPVTDSVAFVITGAVVGLMNTVSVSMSMPPAFMAQIGMYSVPLVCE